MDALVDQVNRLNIHELDHVKAYFQPVRIILLVEKIYPLPILKGSNSIEVENKKI